MTIADLKPYPAMKDSGLPWLGTIPASWTVVRNGRLFAERKETGYADLPILEVSLRSGVRVRRFGGDARKQLMSDRDKYKRACAGDLAYNMMRMWQGAVGLAPVEGLVSPAYVVARPFTGVVARFFAYLFRTDAYMGEVDQYSHGIVKDRNRLYWDQFKQMPSACPPAKEQAAIVRFLDHADRQIRRYVQTKRSLITLIEEQKQAAIHGAATRGLDPNVRLKPSGVEWLGDVPEHWRIVRLHQVTDPNRPVMYGIVLPGPPVDEGVFIVKGGNCEPGRLRPEQLSRTTFEIEARYARSRLVARDIVFAIRGGVGAAEVVPPELAGANLTQDAARIAANRDVDPEWLLYALRAPIFQEHVRSQVVGATVRGINIRDLKRVELAVPPVDEQIAICRTLDLATNTAVTAIDRSEREIALLRELRTRLIADVVTGKLDVRETAATLPDEAGDPEPLDDKEAVDADEGVEDTESSATLEEDWT